MCRRILRRRLAHQRERHHVVALVGDRDVLIPDFQRQKQAGLVGILLLVVLVLLKEVFRTVAIRIHERHFAIVQHLMQRLMQRSSPAVAHAELVFVAVARIVIVRNRDRQTIAIHRGIRMGENQVAIDKADAASPRQPSRLMVVSQIALQARKARVFQHEVRLIRRFARMKLRKAAFAFGRAQLNAVIVAQVPLPRKARDIELLPRILIFQHPAVVLIHAADIRLVVIGDRLRIPVLQHFLAHDGGVRRRCIDVANAQLCGRDEVVRAQTRQIHDFQISQAVAIVIRVADPQAFIMREVLLRTFLDVGITTVPHGLIQSDGTYAYITKRVDRMVLPDQSIRLLAMEDFCQLTYRLTNDKYQSSYERCAKVIDRWSSQKGLDMAEFFIRIVFSFLVGNSDMHLKNFSLLETAPGSQEFMLSPAYDMLPVNIVSNDTEETALALNGKKSNLRKKDFFALAAACHLSSAAAEKMIKNLIKKVDVLISIANHAAIPDDIRQGCIALLIERAAVFA